MTVEWFDRTLWTILIAGTVASVPVLAADPMAPCGVADEDAVAAILRYEDRLH